MQNPKLLINRWMTKDGTILISRTQHDFQSHFDQVDQRTVYIDGGLGPYVRVSGDLLNKCLYDTDEDHPEVRGLYLWTSYGINGDEPAQKRPIKDLTTEHIQGIIRTQIHLPDQVLNMFKRELAYRNLNS